MQEEDNQNIEKLEPNSNPSSEVTGDSNESSERRTPILKAKISKLEKADKIPPFLPKHQKLLKKLSTQARDWNKEFQKLCSTVYRETDSDESEGELNNDLTNKELERTLKLRKISVQFAEHAKKLGVIIIKELCLPQDLKTIPAMTGKVGGIAGGEKYLSCGIFFKLSRDWVNLYGGDSYAIKAAEHELKGTMAYIDCRIEGLHFPLMALIRYRGHALLAQSLLPINADTIRYGTQDGCKTIHDDIPILNERMKLAAKLLNIKGHYVWTRGGADKKFLCAPADVEVHEGTDKRFYVIDTARVFPAAGNVQESQDSKKERAKGDHLYKLLRPEFVKLNPVPLSSDAFSKLGMDELQHVHNEEVYQATKRLETDLIPAFAAYLDGRYPSSMYSHRLIIPEVRSRSHQLREEYSLSLYSTASEMGSSISSFEDSDNTKKKHLKTGDNSSSGKDYESEALTLVDELPQLIAEMHLYGINVRYLNFIYAALKTKKMKQLVLTEIIARALKHEMEERWRKKNAMEDLEYTECLVDYYNLVFDTKKDSVETSEYWKQLLSLIFQRFPLPIPSEDAKMRYADDADSDEEDRPKVDLVGDDTEITNFLNQIASTIRINPAHRNECLTRWKLTLGKFCSTLELLRNLVQSKYWDKKLFEPNESDNDMVKACIEATLKRMKEPEPQVVSTPPEVSSLQEPQFQFPNIRQEVDLVLLFQRLSALLGVNWEISKMCSLHDQNSDDSSDTYALVDMEQISIEEAEDDYSKLVHFFSLEEKFSVSHVKSIEPRVKHIHRISFEEGTAIARLAITKTDSEAFDVLEKANKKFEQCLAIKPNDYRALYNWAFSLTNQAEISTGQKAKNLWNMVSEKYARVLVILPNDPRTLWRWGAALSTQAQTETVEEKGRLLKLACAKLNKASQLQPKHFKTRYNAGNALFHYATYLEQMDAEENSQKVSSLLGKAIVHFEEALSLLPHSVDAMQNLGLTLAKKAALISDETERDRLFWKSYSIFQRASERENCIPEIWIGWGNALFRQAESKRITNPNKCLHLFLLAAERYKRVINMKVDASNNTQLGEKDLSKITLEAFMHLTNSISRFKKTYDELDSRQINSRITKLLKTFGKSYLKLVLRDFPDGNLPSNVFPAVRLFVTHSDPELSRMALAIAEKEESRNEREKKRPDNSKPDTWKDRVGGIRKSKSYNDKPSSLENASRSSFRRKDRPPSVIVDRNSNSPVISMNKHNGEHEEFWVRYRKEKKNMESNDLSNPNPIWIVLKKDNKVLPPSSRKKNFKDMKKEAVEPRLSTSVSVPYFSPQLPVNSTSTVNPSTPPPNVRQNKKSLSFNRRSASFGRKKPLEEIKIQSLETIEHPMIVKRDKGEELKKRTSIKRKVSEILRPERKDSKKSPYNSKNIPTLKPLQKKVPIDWNKQVFFAHDGCEAIKMNDMKILENIGSSRFGRTFLATINNEECALIIQIKDNTKPLSNQICVYSHPFLVKTLYVCQDKSKIFYLFRQIKGIPFLDFMQNRRESHDLSPKNLEEVMKFYMAQIFSALECLERWGHVERSFKPDDIMITDEGNVCMTIMYDLESEMDLSFDLASPIYLPPETSNREETLQSLKDNTENNSETIQNLTKNDRKAIWWSLGVFMFVCLTGKQPLNENDRKKIKVKYPNNLSSECRDLLKQLMEKDVDKRLSTIPDLKKHPFFAQVDWDTIHQIEQEIHKPPMKPTPTEIERFTAIRKAKFNIQQSETPSNEPSNLVAPDAHSGLSPGFSTFTKDKT